jgi:hypothetical protein
MSLLQVLEAATQDTKYSKVLCVVCVCVRERERERKGWIKGGREGERARARER